LEPLQEVEKMTVFAIQKVGIFHQGGKEAAIIAATPTLETARKIIKHDKEKFRESDSAMYSKVFYSIKPLKVVKNAEEFDEMLNVLQSYSIEFVE
jgi:hypothetical protein